MTDYEISPDKLLGPEIPAAAGEPKDHGWYYTVDGIRHGPVSLQYMQNFVNKKMFDESTRVWRKGMKDWASVRDSELSNLVSSEPPPVPANLVSNVAVWGIVLLPIAFGLIDGWKYPTEGVSYFIPAILSSILCVWDAFLLKRAGYKAQLIGAFLVGLFMVPVYLWARSHLLQQRPYFALAWLASIVVAAIIYGSASS